MDLEEIVRFLDWFFQVHQYAETGGVCRSSSRPIHRVGLLLEPFPEISAWVSHHRLDAIFLHRPWKLEGEDFPPDVGVISYHLAFDERLTIGFNARLAEVLCLSELEVLGEKEGRAIGMIGNVPIQEFIQCCQQVSDIFAGVKKVIPAQQTSVSRIAVVGAMTDLLIREAADRGAKVYITGQYRNVAEAAVFETGMGAIEVGHQRCERWGLRALAAILQERWSNLTVMVKDDL